MQGHFGLLLVSEQTTKRLYNFLLDEHFMREGSQLPEDASGHIEPDAGYGRTSYPFASFGVWSISMFKSKDRAESIVYLSIDNEELTSQVFGPSSI